MDNQELVIKDYINNLNNLLNSFAEHANERLLSITDNLNYCKANLVILEKKIENSQE